MKLTFNSIDIFDMVVDEVLADPQLWEIYNKLLADRRGGELAHLWESEEFITSLLTQLGVTLYPVKAAR